MISKFAIVQKFVTILTLEYDVSSSNAAINARLELREVKEILRKK